MLAAVFEGKGNLELKDRPKPRLSSTTDVLIKVTGVGICGTDLHILQVPPAGGPRLRRDRSGESSRRRSIGSGLSRDEGWSRCSGGSGGSPVHLAKPSVFHSPVLRFPVHRLYGRSSAALPPQWERFDRPPPSGPPLHPHSWPDGHNPAETSPSDKPAGNRRRSSRRRRLCHEPSRQVPRRRSLHLGR